MKVGLIVPGPSDRKTIQILLKKKFPQWNFEARPAGGDDKVEHKLEGIAPRLWEAGCDKVIAIRDAETEDPVVIERRVKQKSQNAGVSVCIAKRALEAWLLADLKFNPVLRPENLPNPKAEMKKRFRAAGREGYLPARDAPKIASDADPDRIAERCPSFQKLIKLVKDP